MKIAPFLLLFALMLIQPAVAAAEDDTFFGGFNGRWEGTLQFVAADAYDKNHGYATRTGEYAIAVNGESVSVYFKDDDGAWIEPIPGGFRIISHKTNAVVFGHTSSVGDEKGNGGWVETWNFTITHKDSNGLYVILTRAVNNFRMPYDYNAEGTSGRFFTIGHGELTHVADVKVP